MFPLFLSPNLIDVKAHFYWCKIVKWKRNYLNEKKNCLLNLFLWYAFVSCDYSKHEKKTNPFKKITFICYIHHLHTFIDYDCELNRYRNIHAIPWHLVLWLVGFRCTISNRNTRMIAEQTIAKRFNNGDRWWNRSKHQFSSNSHLCNHYNIFSSQ